MQIAAWQKKMMRQILDFDEPKPDLGDTSVIIYQQNLIQALLACLRRHYKHCLEYMGDGLFLKLSREYISLYPMGSLNLNNYGCEFPGFLRDCQSLVGADFYADLAQLELGMTNNFYAKDQREFDFLLYQELVVDNKKIIKLQRSDNITLFRSSYFFDDIVKKINGKMEACINNKKTEFDVRNIKKSDYSYYCIYRKDDASLIDSITKNRFDLLSQLKRGVSLEEISQSPVSCHLLADIPKWIESGWIDHFYVEENSSAMLSNHHA